MKHSQAIDLVAKLLNIVQKFRSNALTELGNGQTTRLVLAKVGPFTFNDQYALIPQLSKILAAAADGHQMEPQTFYNLMTICHRLEPMLGVVAEAFFEQPLPLPDIHLIVDGWEPETNEPKA